MQLLGHKTVEVGAVTKKTEKKKLFQSIKSLLNPY